MSMRLSLAVVFQHRSLSTYLGHVLLWVWLQSFCVESVQDVPRLLRQKEWSITFFVSLISFTLIEKHQGTGLGYQGLCPDFYVYSDYDNLLS